MFFRLQLVAFVCVYSKFNAVLDQYSFSAAEKYGDKTVWIKVFIKKSFYPSEDPPKKGDLVYIEGLFNMNKSSFEKRLIMNATFIRYIRKTRDAPIDSLPPLEVIVENASPRSVLAFLF